MIVLQVMFNVGWGRLFMRDKRTYVYCFYKVTFFN